MSGCGFGIARPPGRRVKCVRMSPAAISVCTGLRVRRRHPRFPRLCVLAGALRRTLGHPQALPSAAVVVSTASSVLRPDPPDSRLRTDFAFSLIRSALPFADAPGEARALPGFASCAFLSCRCPYGGGTLRLHWPVSLSEVTAFAHAGRARLPLVPRHSLLPGVLITSRQHSLDAAAREFARLPW